MRFYDVRGSSSEWNIHKPTKRIVSKACNYYFSLKQQILVEITCLCSPDFCPSKQQVNDCIETAMRKQRKGVKGKVSHKTETISNGTCEHCRKTADKVSMHPDNPMSATVKTERNDGKKLSSLGHSTRF